MLTRTIVFIFSFLHQHERKEVEAMFILQPGNRKWIGLFFVPLIGWSLHGGARAQESTKPLSQKETLKAAELKTLLRERCDLVNNQLLPLLFDRYKAGTSVRSVDYSTVHQTGRDALKANLVLDIGHEERMASLRKYQQTAEKIATVVKERFDVGSETITAVQLANVILLETRLAVLAQSKPLPQKEMKSLLKERYDLLDRIIVLLTDQYKAGRLDLATVAQVGNVLNTNLELDIELAQRITPLKNYQEAVAQIERHAGYGLGRRGDSSEAKLLLLKARMAVLAHSKSSSREAAEYATQLKSLAKEQLNHVADQFQAGTVSVATLLQAERDALKAGLEINSGPKERIGALRKYQEIEEKALKGLEDRHKRGLINRLEVDLARAALLEVRIELLREELNATLASPKSSK